MWHQNIQIGNQAIPNTDMPKFLGDAYDKQLTFGRDTESIARREAARNNFLMRLAGVDWGWSREAARLVYTATQRNLL